VNFLDENKLIVPRLQNNEFIALGSIPTVVECLAGKSVRTRQHLHPITLDYLYYQHLKICYPLRGQTVIELFTEYKRQGNILITSKL